MKAVLTGLSIALTAVLAIPLAEAAELKVSGVLVDAFSAEPLPDFGFSYLALGDGATLRLNYWGKDYDWREIRTNDKGEFAFTIPERAYVMIKRIGDREENAKYLPRFEKPSVIQHLWDGPVQADVNLTVPVEFLPADCVGKEIRYTQEWPQQVTVVNNAPAPSRESEELPGTCKVLLVNEAGQPLAYTSFEFFWLKRTVGRYDGIEGCDTLRTDAEGRASITTEPRQGGYLKFDAADYALTFVGLPWGSDLRITLAKPAQPFSGRTLDWAGKPISGAQVQINYVGPLDYLVHANPPLVTKSAADGRFAFPRVERSHLCCSSYDDTIFSAAGYADRWWVPGWGDPSDSIHLTPGVVVSGVVLDAKTHQPVPEVTVYRFGHWVKSYITDASGRFQFEPLPPGQYGFYAGDYVSKTDGPVAPPVSVVLLPGKNVELTFYLDEGIELAQKLPPGKYDISSILGRLEFCDNAEAVSSRIAPGCYYIHDRSNESGRIMFIDSPKQASP